MAMAMARLHVHVRYCPFCFLLPARCTVARFVRSSGEAFSSLTELPATTEGESSRDAPCKDTRQDCGPYVSWRSGSLFNFCTSVV